MGWEGKAQGEWISRKTMEANREDKMYGIFQQHQDVCPIYIAKCNVHWRQDWKILCGIRLWKGSNTMSQRLDCKLYTVTPVKAELQWSDLQVGKTTLVAESIRRHQGKMLCFTDNQRNAKWNCKGNTKQTKMYRSVLSNTEVKAFYFLFSLHLTTLQKQL